MQLSGRCLSQTSSASKIQGCGDAAARCDPFGFTAASRRWESACAEQDWTALRASLHDGVAQLVLLGRLVDERFVDVRNDTTACDCGLHAADTLFFDAHILVLSTDVNKASQIEQTLHDATDERRATP